MAATKLTKGWSSVTVVGTTVSHVQSVSFGKGGSLLPYIGDANTMPTVIAVQASHPHATVVSADLAALAGFEVGAAGSIVATTPDALGAVGGNLTFTLANSVIQNVDVSGSVTAYGTGTVTALASSSDGGVTPPLSVTAA